MKFGQSQFPTKKKLHRSFHWADQISNKKLKCKFELIYLIKYNENQSFYCYFDQTNDKIDNFTAIIIPNITTNIPCVLSIISF